MEGCRWDAKQNSLAESDPKALFTEMPSIHIVVASTSSLEANRGGMVVNGTFLPDREKGAYYACPVYRTVERRGTLSTTVRLRASFVRLAQRLTEGSLCNRGTRRTS